MRAFPLCPVCLALAIAAFPAASPADGDLGATPQLLANTGFEEGVGERAAEWGQWPPAGRDEGVGSERDAEVRHSGSYSGRLRVTAADFDGVCTWHHAAVAVTPGQEIVLSYWSRGEDILGQSGCDVQLRRGVQEIVGSRAAPQRNGTFDWVHTVHRFVVPEGSDHICVVPVLRGTGTVWFDDIVAYGTPSVEAMAALAPEIDGDLSDPCWSARPPLTGFSLADGSGLPRWGTEARVAHDRDHLYIAFRCHKSPEDALVSNVTLRDGPVWQDDDVEVFLNLSGDRSDYYQFVLNPIGIRYDSHRMDPSWSIEWAAATRRDDDCWTAEIAIAFSELPIDLTTGTDWCLNLCRANKAAGEVSAWSCPFGGFHSPARLGSLTGLDVDFSPRFARDAAARLQQLRREHTAATEGVETRDAPEWIAGPYSERNGRITGEIARLEALLQAPADVTREQWAEFSQRVDGLSVAVTELQAAGLRLRVYGVWKEEGAGDPRLGLACCSPMTKVFRSGEGFAGEVVREVKLSAARNEAESAQIVAVSLAEEDIAGCTAGVGDLTGPGGARIGAENLHLRLVGYVRTAEPKYATALVGEWPDPLLPNGPFTLPARQLQPLWLTVRVPQDAVPGDYRGMLALTAGEGGLRLGVQLHVYPFALPTRQHLATPFGCDPGDLSRWYTGSSDYLTHLPPEVFTRWNEFLLDYRLTPTRVGQSYIREDRDAQGNVIYDYAVSDRCMEAVAHRLPRRGVNMASVGHFGWRSINGASLTYTEGGADGTARAARVKWPQTEGWASVSRSLDGKSLAGQGCRAFRFQIRCDDQTLEGQRITAFVNDFPDRWVTTFALAPGDWQEVRIPVEQYRHNTDGTPLDLAALAAVGNIQFVIDRKQRPIEYLMDQLVAECDGGDVVVDDFELASELEQIEQRAGAYMEHWKQKGWFDLGHVYGWDEARPEEYEQVVLAYQRVLDAVPDAPIMQTYYVNPTPDELVGVVDVWCAITSVYNEEFLEQRRAAGEDVWLYVCCGPTPPYANFFVDQPGIDHRIVFWQTWARHCTGFLYWRVNYWHGMFPEIPENAQWPDETWDLANLATYKEFKVNGDGWLLYPGPDMEPWPSVRLENIRDGIEDYEYLHLLRELAPEHELLRLPDDVAGSFTEFTRTPERLTELRKALARSIEAAM